MLRINDVINILESYAPLENQAEYDNSGLLYGLGDWEYKGAVITLDTSVDVVEEAIKKGANLIIEHHPSIFGAIKKIDLCYPKHRAIVKAIKNDIAIYSAHTSVDFANGGLNDKVMELIGCVSYHTANGNLSDMRIGKLRKKITLKELAEKVGEAFNDRHIAYVGKSDLTVENIAVINGGGGSHEEELLEAVKSGADVFISADFKYNVIRLAKDLGYAAIIFGHYESEMPFIDLIKDMLTNKGIGNVFGSTACTNPLN